MVSKNHEETKSKLQVEMATNKQQQNVAMAEYVKFGDVFKNKAEQEGLSQEEAIEVGYL